MFLEEKIYNEVALMKYIAANTHIPIPRVVGYGKAEDNPTGLGPFIILTWADGKPMSEMEKESEEDDDIPNPDIDVKTLEILYGQMAEILLELWKVDFDLIGSLHLDEDTGKPSIKGPPLTHQTNDLTRARSVSAVDCVPSTVFHSSADYIFSLLQQQSINLEQQRNSISDSEDGRLKFAARHLMKSIALNFISRFTDNHGPFKLFSDDLCPHNVLVDGSTLQVTAVIDWEFCYAAPAQFAGSSCNGRMRSRMTLIVTLS